MRRALAIMLGIIMALGLAMVAALNSVGVTRNLTDELVSASFVFQVPVESLSQATAGGRVGLEIDIDLSDTDFLLYGVDLAEVELVFVDEIEVPDDEVVFYREISEQQSLATLVLGATDALLVVEARAFRPDFAPPFRALVFALDADGRAIASDFRDQGIKEQLDKLSEIVITEDLDWSAALASLIRAGRDRELGDETEDALGARLLEAIES